VPFALGGSTLMPRYHWTDKAVAEAITMLSAGATYGDTGAKLGFSQGAVAGLIYRMRKSRDPKLPPALRVKSPGKQPDRTGQRTFVETSPHQRVAHLPAVDERRLDLMRDRAAINGAEELLRAQLRTGQHLLATAVARALAEAIGMSPAQVRPAASARRAAA
jgi:hypothetical protein